MADNDESWQYDLDDVGPDADPQETSIEPGSPSAENVVFFLLGVVFVLGVIGVLVFG